MIKNNIYSPNDNEHMDIIEDDDEIRPDTYSTNTRIFSDCFRSYQESDFQNLGLILKRVNHSVWFGISSLHKNTIELLCHQLKLITNKFSGLIIELLKKSFDNNEIEL